MINRISFIRTNTLINLFKQQNVYHLKTPTRNFLSPAALSTSTIFNNLNYLETKSSIYLKKVEKLKYLNYLEVNKSILPFLQNRNFCSNKKNSTSSNSTKLTDQDGEESKKIQSQQEPKIDIEDEIPKQSSIFAKFKIMYKKYWYVLIPVHLVTSLGWFFGFYFVSQSGVDIPQFLELIHVSETMINKVKDSNMGHYAIAYLCYKLITPIRYAVTLGGTTVSIRYLVRLGYIQPVPTKKEVMDKFKKATDDFKQRRKNN